jgi:hypothetical protein
MREVGCVLQAAAKEHSKLKGEQAMQFEDETVRNFARNIRLIVRNTLSYANAGPMVVSAGGEMLRIFERLLLDWVLAPEDKRPPLDLLDDDLCVEPHSSDLESTVLLCDGCEGNYNISRLDPPLHEIPKGDWYCPRCLSCRWWGDLDPRVGKSIPTNGSKGKITRCLFAKPEASKKSTFLYKVETQDGNSVLMPLEQVDLALQKSGNPVPPIRCLEAVTESLGYGSGIDHGFRPDIVPVLVNPHVADGAAQITLTSSVFRELVSTAAILMINDTEEMKASEWLQLLTLLLMKCSSSDMVQNIASKMEVEAAEKMAKEIEHFPKNPDFIQALPDPPFEDVQKDAKLAEEQKGGIEDPAKEESTSTSNQKNENTKDSNKEVQPDDAKPSDIKGDAAPPVVEARAVEVVAIETDQGETDVAFVEANTLNPEEDECKTSRALALIEKARRQKSREDGIAAFCIKNELRSTVASFEEDNVSQTVESTLAPKAPGLSFAQTRCRGSVCNFCGLSDTALGTALMRVPNDKEWEELIQHATRVRRTHLVADLRNIEKTIPSSKGRGKQVMKVTVRIGDDLISDEPDDEYFTDVTDGGMLEFVPRNADGFVDELLFRYEFGLPFVTGSMNAHESCAIAAHNARKVKVVEKFKERQAFVAEREAGIKCGRTLELGSDSAGRSYWHFNGDLDSLYICQPMPGQNSKWQKFSDPEAIASVIVSLGKDPLVPELKMTFVKAASVIQDGTWSELLMKRRFKINVSKEEAEEKSQDSSDTDMEIVEDSDAAKDQPSKEEEEEVRASKYFQFFF